MSKYEIRYIEEAIIDLTDIFEYYKSTDIKYANRILDKLDNRICILKTFPTIGKVFSHPNLINNHRIVHFDDYLIIYIIIDNILEIRRVIHCKRDYINFI